MAVFGLGELPALAGRSWRLAHRSGAFAGDVCLGGAPEDPSPPRGALVRLKGGRCEARPAAAAELARGIVGFTAVASRFCRPVARRAALSGVEPAWGVLRRLRPCSAAVLRADSRAYRLAFAPADRPARARALGVDERRVAGREADRKERPGHEMGARQSSRRALRRSRRPPGRPCSVTRARALRESSAGEASPGEASPRAMSGQAPSMGTRAYPPLAWPPLAGRASRQRARRHRKS